MTLTDVAKRKQVADHYSLLLLPPHRLTRFTERTCSSLGGPAQFLFLLASSLRGLLPKVVEEVFLKVFGLTPPPAYLLVGAPFR